MAERTSIKVYRVCATHLSLSLSDSQSCSTGTVVMVGINRRPKVFHEHLLLSLSQTRDSVSGGDKLTSV